jgi:hypothetical protein
MAVALRVAILGAVVVMVVVRVMIGSLKKNGVAIF